MQVPVKSATFARLRDPVIRSLLEVGKANASVSSLMVSRIEALVPLLFIDLILWLHKIIALVKPAMLPERSPARSPSCYLGTGRETHTNIIGVGSC